jgi:hypothetical protein
MRLTMLVVAIEKTGKIGKVRHRIPLFPGAVVSAPPVFYAALQRGKIMEPSPSPSPPPRPNRRRSRRQPPKTGTRVRAYRNAFGLGPNIALSILDLAETGARLLLSEEIKPGADFELGFESASARPVKLQAQIVWSVPSDDGRFLVGVRFHKALSYAELHALSRT